MAVLGSDYLMDNCEETTRLEIKTDPEAVKRQAEWCGIRPGMRVLDAGCGPGITTAILRGMLGSDGQIVGLDYSRERICHAGEQYGNGTSGTSITFCQHDLRDTLPHMEPFDLIWVRFVLEYNLLESRRIVENLSQCLKPGGCLCLLDLDHNCLNHYLLPGHVERTLFSIMERLEKHNFDAYAGRKLYSYLYDAGFDDIQLNLAAHHFFYGPIRSEDAFNWKKKLEVICRKMDDVFESHPGGREAFFSEFYAFLLDPRRFTYTPIIMCKGVKPAE